MITPEEIARLRELEKKATPRPCKLGHNMERTYHGADKPTYEAWVETPYFTSNDRGEALRHVFADRDCLQAARNALPDLLDEIERLLAAGFIAVERANKAEAELSAALQRAEALQDGLLSANKFIQHLFCESEEEVRAVSDIVAVMATALSGGAK